MARESTPLSYPGQMLPVPPWRSMLNHEKLFTTGLPSEVVTLADNLVDSCALVNKQTQRIQTIPTAKLWNLFAQERSLCCNQHLCISTLHYHYEMNQSGGSTISEMKVADPSGKSSFDGQPGLCQRQAAHMHNVQGRKNSFFPHENESRKAAGSWAHQQTDKITP